MRHKAQGVDNLAVEMRRRYQAVIIPADIENQHRPSAADFYGVRVRVALPHVHQVAPSRLFDRLAPSVQVTGRRRVFPPRRNEKRFFNDAHEDNLYSRDGFVKHVSPGQTPMAENAFSLGRTGGTPCQEASAVRGAGLLTRHGQNEVDL